MLIRRALRSFLVLALVLTATNGALAQEESPTAPEPPETGDSSTAPPPPRLPQVGRGSSAASPVVRAQAKNWGMFFAFGGMATMTVTNPGYNPTNAAAVFHRVGVKIVLSEKFHIPFHFGTGLLLAKPDNVDAATTWGLDFGAGIQYYFRIWRRIAPYIGAGLIVGLSDPVGADNISFQLGLGPELGVEYYIGDRVSLSAAYQFGLLFGTTKAGNNNTFIFGFGTQSLGLLRLTFYF
jgi:hypothetical protein